MAKKKRFEFSKILALITAIMTIATATFVMVYSWTYQQTEPVLYLITAVFAAFTAVMTFYNKKSERQNTRGGITYELAMKEKEEVNEDDS